MTGNGHTQRTFIDGEYPPRETVPFCRPKWDLVSAEDFKSLEMLWETHHEDRLGVPPRPITDRGISISRSESQKRLILHYMQPHVPYISNAVRERHSPIPVGAGGWKELKKGSATLEKVWGLYIENLRFVLDDVELLLNNIDAETVCITADHGNAFGEFGAYGHPEGFLSPEIKKLPLVTTSATNNETYDPEDEENRSTKVRTNIEDHLKDLGTFDSLSH